MKKIIYLMFLAVLPAIAQENLTYQRPPEEIARLVEAPLTPFVTFSPDKQVLILMERSDYPTIEQLSRPELRIAGLRINPDNFGPSRGNYIIGLKVKKLSSGAESEIQNLPSPLLLSSPSFSPDSRKLAFLHNNPEGIELWVIDLTTGIASRATNRKINATLGTAFTWLSDSQTLVFTAVPENLKPLPAKSRIPTGPIIEENLGRKAPSRTYQDLLKNPYDEAAFDYYSSSDLVVRNPDGSERIASASSIHSGFSPSPDGRFLLIETIHHPYSYLVPAYLFPQKTRVIDLQGKLVKTLAAYLPDSTPPSGNQEIIAGETTNRQPSVGCMPRMEAIRKQKLMYEIKFTPGNTHLMVIQKNLSACRFASPE
ncbi:MAG: hypothetical protein MUC73_14740 [Cyclobacteriaceae bacterium]|nr:hypothetical protein [Cyclobacteriaceae bacterium]